MEIYMHSVFPRVAAMRREVELPELKYMISEEKLAVQRARDLVDHLDVIYLLESRILHHRIDPRGKLSDPETSDDLEPTAV